MINAEVKQQASRFKKALFIALANAIRFPFPLSLIVGCGTTVNGISVHDHHDGQKMAIVNRGIIGPSASVPYNESQHGKMESWVEEGEEVTTGNLKFKGGKKAIHRHTDSINGQIGAQEFVLE